MIGLMNDAAAICQITYDQLRRKQTMNKKHTFCFKIADVSIEILHRFLGEASKNHLFVDLPDILQDGSKSSLEYDNPELFVNGEVEFTHSNTLTHIGIDKNSFVVTYSKPRYFGRDTKSIAHPNLALLEHHLDLAAPKTHRLAAKGDEIVQLFQTADGSSFKTRAEAEYHLDRKRVIEKLADDTGCTVHIASIHLEWLEANHPKLKED